MTSLHRISTRLVLVGLTVGTLSACAGPLDFDMRGTIGGGLDTSDAAVQATSPRPRPDNRGIISYPSYQVAVARRGDTLHDISKRIGVSTEELASYNGISANAELRRGEVIALPRRVAEPSAHTGGTAAIQPRSSVDIESLAGNAIDNAEPDITTTALPQTTKATTQPGPEPIRHKVQRGETAFTISRLYNVSVRSLAEWNGLGKDFTIREQQTLLIPPVANTQNTGAGLSAAATTIPGQGSPTPTPPSAVKPLPREKTTTAQNVKKPSSPNLGTTQAKSSSKMAYPLNGKIVRPYSKGKNNGIDISAKAGTAVTAAADGKVAAITKDADNVLIVVLRHPDNLMTVYYNVANVKVSKGAAVKRGQTLAALPASDSFVHFEVRKGFDSVDPMPYLK